MIIYMVLLFLLLYNVQNCTPNKIHSYIPASLTLMGLFMWFGWTNWHAGFVYGVMPEGLHKLEHESQRVHDSGMQAYVFGNTYCLEIEICFSTVNLFPLNVNYCFKQTHKLIIFKVINFQSNFYLLSKCQTILEFKVIIEAFQISRATQYFYSLN